jgi:hypothetical protein
MKMKAFDVSYRPFVTVKKRKHFTADVDLQVMARNKKSAMNKTIEILQDWGYKYAPDNRKYIKLKKVV